LHTNPNPDKIPTFTVTSDTTRYTILLDPLPSAQMTIAKKPPPDGGFFVAYIALIAPFVVSSQQKANAIQIFLND